MRRLAIRGRFAAWLAIAAMTLNASWPLIAYAKPNAFDHLPFTLCTAGALQAGSDETENSGPLAPSAQGSLHQHCALCGTAAGHWATPPTSNRLLAANAAPARLRAPPVVAARIERFAYHTARPRGPPAVS